MSEPVEPPDAPPTAPRRRRRLDGRTLGICLCVALIGAIAAYFIAAAVLNDGDTSTGSGTSGSNSDAIKLSNGKVDGTKLLATTIVDPDGKKTTLKSLIGDKPVLVNLWSQSCDPCTREMPILEHVSTADHRLAVIGVNFQDQVSAARRMAKATGITYPWYRDPDGSFGIVSQMVYLPRTVLVDRSGRVLGDQTGEFHSLDEVEKWLDKRLR
jgi:thiol-disulfide isomerase/thioredoxin